MKNQISVGTFCRILCLCVCLAGQAEAQNSIRLRQQGTNLDRVEVQVGQIVTVEVFADLGNTSTSGISVFVTVPADNFLVVDQFPVDVSQVEDLADTTLLPRAGTQPFRAGNLLEGEQRNLLHSPGDLLNLEEFRVLEYQLLLGLSGNRSETGSGIIGVFQLQAIKPVQNSRISILDNVNQETRVVLTDGGERRFRSAPQGMEVNVLGLELRDIPDVLLLPGEADSVQIGSLDQYVDNSLSAVDSIKWSFAPANDSLEIIINPDDRVVKITPLFGWSGRHRIRWTAVDSLASRFFAGPPPEAIEFSDIIVNNPPSFGVPRGADGVKRDSVTIIEDRHLFIGDAPLDPARAFRGKDLDLLVIDPDPQDRLFFAVTPIALVGEPNVRGDDAQTTNELLIWSRPNFAGVDSLQVLVQDEARGRDTLRVIVTVTEEPDAPEFIIGDVNPRISRGSSKSYPFDEFVRDVDTPLDSLLFTFQDERSGNFVVDTLRTGGDLIVRVTGSETFTGTGTVTFQVADPDDPNLDDSLTLFITSAEALPPDVLPPDLKIDLSPGGPRAIIPLDDLVEDPDNDDDELTWRVPAITRSTIDVNQLRELLVQAPGDFVGFEAVELTVSDPSQQSDILPLRIYSSDGRPVVGGVPDIVLEKGEENREFDLDNFYFDADNTDEEMRWDAFDTSGRAFDSDNLQVSIDRLTHLITYFALETEDILTETVIVRVSDPAGNATEDTVQVTIVTDGTPTGCGITISPPLPDVLQVEIPQIPEEILDLDQHLQTSPSVSRDSIRWELTDAGRLNGVVLRQGSKLFVFSPEEAGFDTIQVAAICPLGQRRTASTAIRYITPGLRIDLAQIPDIQFVVGNALSDLNLNDFILNSETHPDSVIQWSLGLIGSSDIIFKIDEDSLFTAFATGVDSAVVVLTARNTALGVTGRDTVRVFAVEGEVLALKPFPQLIVGAGREDSSIVLNNFIPDDGPVPTATNWSVAGQRITLPFIDPSPPHLLRLGTVADRVGSDTLTLTVDLGAGFKAAGELIVTVEEKPPDNVLELRIIPNPTNPEFIDIFVLARLNLDSSPTVVFSFGTADSTVAVRQIEDDLPARGVLIWSGNVKIPAGAVGTVSFAAQALTALGSDISASASVSIGTATASKPLALRHGSVELALPQSAVEEGTRVMLQTTDAAVGGSGRDDSFNDGHSAGDGELRLKTAIGLYPAGLALERQATLRTGQADPADGLYRREGGRWVYVSPAGDDVAVSRFERYAILTDVVPPRIGVLSISLDRSEVVAEVSDGGSGIQPQDVELEVAGRRLEGSAADGRFTWVLPSELIASVQVFGSGGRILASDRAGNRSEHAIYFEVSVLPSRLALGDSYPNPFNPDTTIPFEVPIARGGLQIGEADRVRLAIYSVTGQLVRVLVDDSTAPGRHRVIWNGRDDGGRRVSSGLYLYRLETETESVTKRMTLLK